MSDRFEKFYLSEVFQLLWIQAATERPILNAERKTFSRVVIEGVTSASWSEGTSTVQGQHKMSLTSDPSLLCLDGPVVKAKAPEEPPLSTADSVRS